MDEEEQLRRYLLRRAEANEALMDDTTAPVKALLAEADVVAGVWRDEHEPHGIGCLIIKGGKLLRQIATGQSAVPFSSDAILCEDHEQAVAVMDTLGERDLDA